MSDPRLTTTRFRSALCGSLLLAAVAGSAPANETMKDPTRPPALAAVVSEGREVRASGEPRVSSIVVSGHRRVAVVDGRSVHIGDLVASGEVSAIEAGSVHVMGPDGPQVLPLFHSPITKTPSTSTGGKP